MGECGGGGRHGKADHELASLAGPVAVGGHAAVVQLDQRPDQGQSDSQSAARARQGLIGLGEQVEHLGQQLGGDADPVVADADRSTSRPDCSAVKAILPPSGGVFRGVVQQVGEHLGQPRRIDFQEHRLVGQRDRQVMLIVLDQRPAGLDGQLDHLRQLDRLLLEVDLAAGDPRNVEQVVDHPRHVLDLVFDHLDRPLEVGAVRALPAA